MPREHCKDCVSLIICGTFAYLSGPNHYALNVQLTLRHRLLWVDAICIDQENIEERGQQVSMMDLIYQQASRVLIHLGDAYGTTDAAMDIIARREIVQDLDKLMIVVEFFQTQPWFNRVWVLQEVALAEVALVICGTQCVPWACFPVWWARNAVALDGLADPPPTLSYDPIVKKRASLLHQLHNTRRSRATDSRDKVYALIGLLSKEDRIGILVDYNMPVWAVYTHVTRAIIARQSSLRVLSGVLDPPEPGSLVLLDSSKLPSWVPDWSYSPRLSSFGLSNDFLEPYDAGGSPAWSVRMETSGPYELTLDCLGIVYDTAELLGDICPVTLGEEVGTTFCQWAGLVSRPSMKASKFQHRLLGSFKAPRNSKDSSRQFSEEAPKTLWPTILAQPSFTIELSPEDLTETVLSERIKLSLGPEIEHIALELPSESIKFSLGRRLLVTKSGILGLAPASTVPGDLVVVLLGAPVPHILRKQADGDYILVGECYVHGIMGGEALAHLHEYLSSVGHRSRPFRESKSNAPLQRFRIGRAPAQWPAPIPLEPPFPSGRESILA
ncbi:heterokaryon incompatibility protein-domain-containing protein [Podospora didyma]|uniref:Heterokaryon incompatibility protein-domain-containing protein n=1 Tax=Podospora didyma TaxID=330526 RepID=A0AAE0K0B4_9PEZI|nr:heterokaryon incompatibility protein-domain-containing protein [Podospora didyma]